MNIGRRCSSGCATWPDDDEYSVCPGCGEATQRFRGLTPLNREDAAARRLHAEFEYYYENEHVADTTPLTDDELRKMGINLD